MKDQIKVALLSGKKVVTTEEALHGKMYKSVFEYRPESGHVRIDDYIVYPDGKYKERFGEDNGMELTLDDGINCIIRMHDDGCKVEIKEKRLKQ